MQLLTVLHALYEISKTLKGAQRDIAAAETEAAAGAVGGEAAAAVPLDPLASVDQASLKQLVNMGFPENRAAKVRCTPTNLLLWKFF